jgi:hypothetical protein
MSKSFSAKPKLANWIVNIREFVEIRILLNLTLRKLTIAVIVALRN